MENAKKLTTPPYVAYRTLKNFFEKLSAHGVPGRIERSLMGTMSGAVQSQLTTTLKSLGFMSENSVPSDLLRRYIAAEGAEQSKMMKALLEEHYPFIFGADFNFSTATGSMVRERFEENTTATGETITRCIAFLKDAAQDAGCTVSPFLSHKRGGTPASKKKAPQGQRKNADSAPVLSQPPVGENRESHTPIAAQDSLLLWGLFQRLPRPGSSWPKADRERWTDTLNNVLALEYKE